MYETLRRKWQACEALANDRSTTDGERENARRRADEFRAKLDELERQNISSNYEQYVAQGLQARKNLHASQWVLGALARNVEIEYGKRTLQKYAKDIGVEYGTLRNYRATFEAWLNAAGRPENFAIATALNSHPDRYQVVARFPKLTFRQAREIMRSYKGGGSTSRARTSAGANTGANTGASASAGFGNSRRQHTASPPPPPPRPPPKPTLEQAREAYLGLALKLSMKERTREAIKIINKLGVRMS
jgi:hypothetical protein